MNLPENFIGTTHTIELLTNLPEKEKQKEQQQ
jgi:hypothetical protein